MLVVASFAATAHAADESPQSAARKHFLQGVALVDNQRLAEALAEFEQCYALYPAYGTLYNIAEVHAALGHPVEAAAAFEKYLSEGGAAIPAKRRSKVEEELAAQRAKIGELTIHVSPPEAELRLDQNLLVGVGAPSTLSVPAGAHRVSAVLAGYRSQQREVEVRARERLEVVLTLEPAAVVLAPPVAPATAIAQAPSRELPADHGAGQRFAGFVVGGLGLATVGAGVAIAVAGQAKHQDALDQWYAGDKEGARGTESASMNQKTAGYVVIGLGGAASVAGAILLLSARSSPKPAPAAARTDFSCSPWLMPSLFGASLRRSW